jgi:hypothetical protein
MSSWPFDIFDNEESDFPTFWNPYSLPQVPQKTLHSGTLFFLTRQKNLKPRQVEINKTHIFRFNKTGAKIKSFSRLNWKKLEPFTEVNKSDKRFGFRLGHSQVFQDFYTGSSEELDGWLSFLTSLTILQDIDEDFIVLKEIGSGNYGRVYLVEDRSTHSLFAMKALEKRSLEKSEQAAKSLKNEIQIMRQVEHPRIVKLERVYDDDERISFIITHASGDLFERLSKSGRFSEECVSDLALNLMTVLAYLHGLSIMHRDLKPENLLVRGNNDDILVCDFGLSCLVNDKQVSRCGSPGYVAPEILHNHDYSEKVDIFSVGVILYMLLVGNSPFVGRNAKEILIKNKQCKIEYQPKIWNLYSRSALDFVQKLLNPDPDSRLSALEALRHPWIAKRVEQKEITPVTANSCSGEVELWKVPTLIKIDKPAFTKRAGIKE